MLGLCARECGLARQLRQNVPVFNASTLVDSACLSSLVGCLQGVAATAAEWSPMGEVLRNNPKGLQPEEEQYSATSFLS